MHRPKQIRVLFSFGIRFESLFFDYLFCNLLLIISLLFRLSDRFCNSFILTTRFFFPITGSRSLITWRGCNIVWWRYSITWSNRSMPKWWNFKPVLFSLSIVWWYFHVAIWFTISSTHWAWLIDKIFENLIFGFNELILSHFDLFFLFIGFLLPIIKLLNELIYLLHPFGSFELQWLSSRWSMRHWSSIFLFDYILL